LQANNLSLVGSCLPYTAAQSKATTTNPKDLQGSKKVPLGQVCPVAMAHEACAMLDGDLKYGYRNWREKNVVANIYIHAALRHLQSWAEKQEVAEDSGVHHLGHARACLGILLDAQANGNLIDDRAAGVFPEVAHQLEDWVTKRVAKHTLEQAAKAQAAARDQFTLQSDTLNQQVGMGYINNAAQGNS